MAGDVTNTWKPVNLWWHMENMYLKNPEFEGCNFFCWIMKMKLVSNVGQYDLTITNGDGNLVSHGDMTHQLSFLVWQQLLFYGDVMGYFKNVHQIDMFLGCAHWLYHPSGSFHEKHDDFHDKPPDWGLHLGEGYPVFGPWHTKRHRSNFPTARWKMARCLRPFGPTLSTLVCT